VSWRGCAAWRARPQVHAESGTSANTGNDDKARCPQAGMNKRTPKPLFAQRDPAQLVFGPNK